MIEINNISKSWNGFRLSGISARIKKNEILGIWGHNGAGKTLLLETVAGLWYPDKGSIIFRGKDITFDPPEKRNVGFVCQDHCLFPHLSVKDNIMYGLRFRRLSQKERQKRLDELFISLRLESLVKRNNPSLLSGGEKQRVSLARALASDPDIVCLDEPTQSLDGEGRELFYSMVKNLRSVISSPVIFVSHDYDELRLLSNRIAVMEKGKIIRIDELVSFTS